jgi:hypothetical protein
LYNKLLRCNLRTLVAVIISATSVLPAMAAQSICADAERIKLAQEYTNLTYFREITRETAVREVEMGWHAFKICTDDRCEANLRAIIAEQMDAAISDYERDTVNLVALKLTKEQLLASIAFVKSPAGRAIAEMNRKMVPDIANMNNAFSMRVSASVFQDFCAKEVEACKRVMNQTATKDSLQ